MLTAKTLSLTARLKATKAPLSSNTASSRLATASVSCIVCDTIFNASSRRDQCFEYNLPAYISHTCTTVMVITSGVLLKMEVGIRKAAWRRA